MSESALPQDTSVHEVGAADGMRAMARTSREGGGAVSSAGHTARERLLQRLSGMSSLDGLANRVHRAAMKTRQAAGPVLAPLGHLVGHPVHPVLTDLPIGFWTSAWVLDIVGGRGGRPAARLLVGAGVLSALPAAVSGLHDAGDRDGTVDRRLVGLHAGCNAAATVAYTLSWRARKRDRWGRGVLLGTVGAALATAGGLLGGELAFGARSEGVVSLRPEAGDEYSSPPAHESSSPARDDTAAG